YTFPLDNASHSSSVPPLCPTATTHFFLPSAYTLLFLTSLPGNALSLWVTLRCISATSPIHVYLSHLSISNLMLSLTAPFLAAYYARGSVWTQSGVPCRLVLHGVTPVLHINIYIGIMILMWVALSRFAVLIQHTHASRPSSCATLLPPGFFACLKRTSFASRVCTAAWVVAVGGGVPVTVYYSVKEAVSADATATAGCANVCYNPAVEIGGIRSATMGVPAITLFFVFYLLVLLSYMTVQRHIRRSRQSTSVPTSQCLLGRVLRNIAVIQLKNCLLFLAALRGSTDPLMYFLLDKTFRNQTLRLLRCTQNNPESRQVCSATGSGNQKAAQLVDGNVATTTGGLSQESV
ncbi:hypothetical protein FQN60_001602, partial [Etheostoma spectabile]